MANQELLSSFQAQHSQYQRFALKICRNQENSEDVMQQVAERLLKYAPTSVNDVRRYIFTVIRRTYISYIERHCNKDVHLEDMENVEARMERYNPCQYTADLEDSFKLQAIATAAMYLPRHQREAILNALAGNDMDTSDPARYESLKTNRRLGILKLRDQLAGAI